VAILGAAATACGLVPLPTAAACDPPAVVYKKVVTYKTVEERVVTKVPYKKDVLKYDHYGKPYRTHEVYYTQVIEVVYRTAPVATWVKVCD
jgi:hypothetical protein